MDTKKTISLATKPRRKKAEPIPAVPPAVLRVRGLLQSASKAVRFTGRNSRDVWDTVIALKDFPEPNPVIEWDDIEECCIVDVDFHHGGIPHPQNIRRVMLGLPWQPLYWWISHGGGIKAVYGRTKLLSAREVAAIAVLLLHQEFPTASGWELKPGTRHPAFPRGEERCGEVFRGTGLRQENARRILLGDRDPEHKADPDRVAEWLDDNGLAIGARYGHERCPISPTDSGERDPVSVLDEVIFCHVCAAKGVCFPGVSKAGVAPLAMLIGDEAPRVVNHLRNMVRNVTHMQHAQYVLGDIPHAKTAYQALLKLQHIPEEELSPDGDESVILRLRRRLLDLIHDPTLTLVRGDEIWLQSDDLKPASHAGQEKQLAAIPATQFVNTDGKPKICVSQKRLGLFQGRGDLTPFGYPPLTIIRGVDIAAHARVFHEDGRIRAVSKAMPAIAYVPLARRDMAWVEAWFKKYFPGICYRYLRLLIACKGLVQLGHVPLAPAIYATGPSGCGKTSTIQLAAVASGDEAPFVNIVPDPARTMQSYGAASACATYAILDEFAKSNLSGPDQQQLFLRLKRGASYHRLYHGTAYIRDPAVVCLTDVEVSDTLLADAQAGRRICMIDLGAGATLDGDKWLQTCGTGCIERWRSDDPLGKNASACDQLISDVMDEFFYPESRVTFEEIVHAHGFRMMAEQVDSFDQELREFYAVVVALPEHDGSSRWTGAGWRVIDRRAGGATVDMYNALTNYGEDMQRLRGAQWGRIVGVRGTVLTIRPHGQKVGIRFTNGEVPG